MARPPNLIKELRGRLSVAALSAKSGVDKNAISMMERGKQELTLGKMRKIAHALGVPPTALLNSEDVEFRPDGPSVPLAEILREIAREDQVEVVAAARAVVQIARGIAAKTGDVKIIGDPDQVARLVSFWNDMSESQRERAIQLIEVMRSPDVLHRQSSQAA